MGDEHSRRTLRNLRDVPTVEISGVDRVARETDARASAQEVAKWQAVFDAGLVNLDSVPVLRQSVKWTRCDDIEVRVLLRIRAGTKIAQILDDATYSRTQIIQAICRLASRGLLRLS